MSRLRIASSPEQCTPLAGDEPDSEECDDQGQCRHPRHAIVRKYGGVACRACGETLSEPDDGY